MRKVCLAPYYFTVEGETELWYLQWLEKKICSDPSARYGVNLVCSIQTNPQKYVKGFTFRTSDEIKITHVFDYESEEPVHVTRFINALDNMKKATGIGKRVKYSLGYSNFAFELWIVLHKADCNGPLTNRTQYLDLINKAYSKKFEDLDKYKHKDNFKQILDELELDNVRDAIRRSRSIMQNNEKHGLTQNEYKGFRYYKDNPSLSIHDAIEKILRDCGLFPEKASR